MPDEQGALRAIVREAAGEGFETAERQGDRLGTEHALAVAAQMRGQSLQNPAV